MTTSRQGLLALLAAALLFAPIGCTEDEEPLLARAEIDRRIERDGRVSTEVWIRKQIGELRCETVWPCNTSDFTERLARAERLQQLYLEIFEHETGAIEIRRQYGHQLFGQKRWAEAAVQYDIVVQQIGTASDRDSVKQKLDAAYHSLTSRAHLADLGGRPLELPHQVALRQRLLARSAGRPGPEPEIRNSDRIDELLTSAAELERLVPELNQVEHALQLTGRALHGRGDTRQAEERLQRLLDRKPGSLDTWCVTPLLLDSLVRNDKLDQARELARQLLYQPPRQWLPAALAGWDQEPGRKLLQFWRPVLEALSRPGGR